MATGTDGSLAERPPELVRLITECRRLRWAAYATGVACVALSLLMILLFRAPSPNRVLRGSALVLIDSQGRPRIKLEPVSGGGQLEISDEMSRPRFRLHTSNELHYLVFLDAKGGTRTLLGNADGKTTQLWLTDMKSTIALDLDGKGGESVGLATVGSDAGASLSVSSFGASLWMRRDVDNDFHLDVDPRGGVMSGRSDGTRYSRSVAR